MTEGFNVSPDELIEGASTLQNLSQQVGSAAQQAEQEHQTLQQSMSEDESGVARPIQEVLSQTSGAFGSVGQEGSRVLGGASSRVKAEGQGLREADEQAAANIRQIQPKPSNITVNPTEGGSTETSSAQQQVRPPRRPKQQQNQPNPTPKQPKTTYAQQAGLDPGVPATPELIAKGQPPLTWKPPTASGKLSTDFVEHPTLPDATQYEAPTPPMNEFGMPSDKSRGAQLDQVTPPPNGELISSVNGQPVADYLKGKAETQAQAVANPEAHWRAQHPDEELTGKVPGKERVASAVAIDLRTGSVTTGINADERSAIPTDKLHPLLQQNLQNLRAWKHPVEGTDEDPGGIAHMSKPAQHAEVKAVNEILWQRQIAGEAQFGKGYQLPASALDDIRVYTTKCSSGHVGEAFPFCANCNSILHGVPSYTGRYEQDPKDARYDENAPADVFRD